MSVLGDDYRRIVKLAAEEYIELIGYFFWMIGTIEYAFQSRALAMAEPKAAAHPYAHTLVGAGASLQTTFSGPSLNIIGRKN